jgi:3-oxo-4-pregnene-20-carboxyl-CoA dehydrogenase alpha subunit
VAAAAGEHQLKHVLIAGVAPNGPDFTPDETQDDIVRLVGEVLDGTADTPDRLWKSLGQAGLLTLAVPASLGGAGLGPLDTALVLT